MLTPENDGVRGGPPWEKIDHLNRLIDIDRLSINIDTYLIKLN